MSDRREVLHRSAGQAAGCLGLRLAQLRVFGQEAPALHALKTTINSRNILLVSYCLCTARSRHRNQPPAPASYPRVTGRAQTAPGVLIRRRAHGAHGAGYPVELPVPMPAPGPDRRAPGRACGQIDRICTHNDALVTPTMSARARGTAPCAWFTVSCMASSSRFGGGIGSRPRRAHSRLGGAAVVLTHDRRAGTLKRPTASGTRPVIDTAPEKPHRCLSHLHWFARDRDLAWEHACSRYRSLAARTRPNWRWRGSAFCCCTPPAGGRASRLIGRRSAACGDC